MTALGYYVQYLEKACKLYSDEQIHAYRNISQEEQELEYEDIFRQEDLFSLQEKREMDRKH